MNMNLNGMPTTIYDASLNSLEHYGRLGMKWYQHIYGEQDGRAKYAEKGVKKVAKQDIRATNASARASVKKARADQLRQKAEIIELKSERKALRLKKKAYKFYRDVTRQEKRAAKAEKSIQKAVDFLNENLADVSLSNASNSDIALGKQYMIMLFDEMKKAG